MFELGIQLVSLGSDDGKAYLLVTGPWRHINRTGSSRGGYNTGEEGMHAHCLSVVHVPTVEYVFRGARADCCVCRADCCVCLSWCTCWLLIKPFVVHVLSACWFCPSYCTYWLGPVFSFCFQKNISTVGRRLLWRRTFRREKSSSALHLCQNIFLWG